MNHDLARNLAAVRANIRAAAERAGRSPEAVRLLAVTKRSDLEEISALYQLGVKSMGENRVQDLLSKKKSLPSDIEWHLIGSLQTNKVKSILGQVNLIHSLDRWHLATEIQKQASQQGRVVEALVQVNISGETSKSGFTAAEARDFMRQLPDLPNLKLRGLMTMAPYAVNPEEIRYVFRETRLLAEKMRQENNLIELDYLSMGMSNDYQIAVEEGANLIRLGTVIFS